MQSFKFLPVVLILAVTFAIAQEQAPQGEATSPSVPTAPTIPAGAPKTNPTRKIELAPDASGVVPEEQIRELLRQVAEKDIENDKRQRDYTYIQREETHQLDGKGNVKKVESRTTEVLQIYGEEVNRLIAKDDKPLSEKDAKKEEERIQKITDKRKNESESDRHKRLEKEEKDRERGRQFVLEVADAYNFRLVGSEQIDSRDTWVLDADPRPGFEPKSKEAKMLPKFRGRIWIDKAETQWVKLDVTTLDTISFGLFLARIHKGTRVVVETTEVNKEVWLPKHVAFHVDVRLALLKNFNVDVDQTFRDYKKFRSESKITVLGESD